MADFMRLKDGTEFEIEDGASLYNIIHIATSTEDGINVSRAITEENLKHVEFYSPDESQPEPAPVVGDIVEEHEGGDEFPEARAIYGIYDDLGINSVFFDVNNMQVIISLYEKSKLEVRVDALEDGLELTNEALDYLIMGQGE